MSIKMLLKHICEIIKYNERRFWECCYYHKYQNKLQIVINVYRFKHKVLQQILYTCFDCGVLCPKGPKGEGLS